MAGSLNFMLLSRLAFRDSETPQPAHPAMRLRSFAFLGWSFRCPIEHADSVFAGHPFFLDCRILFFNGDLQCFLPTKVDGDQIVFCCPLKRSHFFHLRFATYVIPYAPLIAHDFFDATKFENFGELLQFYEAVVFDDFLPSCAQAEINKFVRRLFRLRIKEHI